MLMYRNVITKKSAVTILSELIRTSIDDGTRQLITLIIIGCLVR